jgi:hypothetical protein
VFESSYRKNGRKRCKLFGLEIGRRVFCKDEEQKIEFWINPDRISVRSIYGCY